MVYVYVNDLNVVRKEKIFKLGNNFIARIQAPIPLQSFSFKNRITKKKTKLKPEFQATH